MSSTDGHTGGGEARVSEVWLESEDGERLSSVPQHQRVSLNARVRFLVDVVDPSASVYVYNEEHRAVVIATTAIENERSGHFEAGEEVVFSFSFDNVLSPGRYSPVFQLAHRGSGLDVIDRFEGSYSFVVTGPGALGGAGRSSCSLRGHPRHRSAAPNGSAHERAGATHRSTAER